MARSGSGKRRHEAAPAGLAPGSRALAAAARTVAQVVVGRRSADDALSRVPAGERSAVQAIALGTLRWYLRLAPAVNALLQRPPADMPPPLHALLVCAAHQVEYSRAPVEVSVNIAVDAARALREPQAAGFVNAVLRRWLRERAELLARLDRDPAVAHAHPRWLVDALARAWPARLEAMLAAANHHPPMTLRVNLARGTREAYLARLQEAGLEAFAADCCEAALTLTTPVGVDALPGFAAGDASVQDAAAQLAAPLLDALPGQRVLDACAAPGGKTGHILERTPGIELTAADDDAARLERVAENLARLQLQATCLAIDLADAQRVRETWPAPCFDRILVDAPCSATGVIRRHPDIKLLRRESDIAGFAARQLRILRACAALLREGGRLVYCSCSVLPAENDAVVARLLEELPWLEPAPLPEGFAAPPGSIATACGLQLLPGGAADTDGFYYACLIRTGAAQASPQPDPVNATE